MVTHLLKTSTPIFWCNLFWCLHKKCANTTRALSCYPLLLSDSSINTIWVEVFLEK